MKTTPLISALFVISGLYDGILGLIFLFAAPALFDRLKIIPPNHFGYVQFLANALTAAIAASLGLIVYLYRP